MIEINLLDSATERTKSIAAVETKVADPRTQMLLIAVVTGAILLVGIGFDYLSARSSRTSAQAELENQKRIAAQMAEITREQADLEKKTNDIKARIEAIQKLRSAQHGPVAVLSAVNERLPELNDFRLASIEQKDGDLVIKGDSPNEEAVTQFGRSLEFSSGLFTNVNIETQRKTLEVASSYNQAAGGAEAPPKPETVDFTIKCKYTPPAVANPSAAKPQTAVITTPATTNGQIAQK